MFSHLFTALSLSAIALSCSPTTTGARPHDMSAESHETSARKQNETAAVHASRYDPNAETQRTRCRVRANRADVGDFDVCWTSVTNPTDEHRRHASEHRKHAADHRAASAALREAEARACAGIAPDDRDISPFEHTEDISSVKPYNVPDSLAEDTATTGRVAGSIVTFRQVSGMTRESLQRIIDCHIARNAALGHSAPNMPNCPLVPKSVEAEVSAAQSGFAVTIQSKDEGSARDVWERAKRLLASRQH